MRSSAERVTWDASLLICALALSYLETFIPAILPGFRLGLANMITVFAVFRVGTADGAMISLARIGLCALLFGSPVSFLYALAGGALSFAVLCLFRYIGCTRFSYIGVCVACAFAHNVGQLAVACLMFGNVLSYLPYLCLAAAVCGTLTGIVLCLLIPRLRTRT